MFPYPISFLSGITADPFSTKSLNFDGVDNRNITYPIYSDLDGQLDFAWSFWFKMDTLVGYQNILAIDNQPQADSRAMKVQIYWNTGNSRLQVYFDNLSYYCYTDNTAWTPSVDTWYHVLITRAQSRAVNDKCRMYIDGVNRLAAENTRYHTFATNATSGINIGDYVGLGYGAFGGNIDEVAIYTQDMAAYISEIYNGGTPDDLDNLASAPSPDVWYRMGENATFKSPQILMPEQNNKDKVSNYSFAFDGSNDTINCGNVTALNGLSHGSWSFWLNSSVTSTQGILNQWGSGADALIYSFIIMSSGRLDIYFDGGAKYRVSGNTVINALNTGEWFNLVIVFDGTLPNNSDETGRLKVYINGTLLDDGFSFVTGPTAMPSPTSDLILGTYPSGTFWDGNMDEVAIFNSSLTQAAVTEIYNSGTPNNLDELTNATDPSAWYRMGEEAIFNSANWLLPNKAQDVFSRYSLNFDGTDDFISIYDGASGSGPIQFNAGDDFSISAWIKTTNAGTTNQIVSFRGTAIIWFSTFVTSGNIRLKVYLRDNSSNVYSLDSYNSAPGWIPSDTWTHVMFTRNGTSKDVNLYINGAAAQVTGSDTTSDNFTSYDKLSLANDNFSGGRYWFDGGMDEVAIFSSDQSANAATIYNSGKPADLTSLSPTSWWRMGEKATFSTNWTIPDQIGSNNGTSDNMTNDDLSGDAPGVIGNGLSANMTIEDRIGYAPNSSNNSLSYNMVEADIVEDTPPN